MPDSLYDVTLTGLAYGGDAIGLLPDAAGKERVVFVPFALPGERVRLRLTEQRRGFARADLVQLLAPSPDRVTPRCKHFGVCGGCHYQHLSYEAQLKAKTGILRDQLRRIGRIEDPPVEDAVPSPVSWHYRNHVQFHLASDGRLGYVRHHGRDILPITECHLPEPALDSLWPQLEFEPGMHLDRVSIRQGADEELMVLLESREPSLPELEMESGASVVHAYEEHSVVMAGRDHLILRVLDRDFRVSAASFFQVNTAMAARLVEHVLALARSLPDVQLAHATVLDVYCGVGLFSAFLAPLCRQLIGIEASSSACEDFAANLDEFDNVELYEDAAENVLPVLDAQPDIVIVDPPRGGLEPAARDGLLRLRPRAVIYISCDPSTLARDARQLIDGGYRLSSSTPFDLFPQTYHIESISLFQRQDG